MLKSVHLEEGLDIKTHEIWISGEPENSFQPNVKDNLDDLFYNVSARPLQYRGGDWALFIYLSLVFLLISNPTSWLRLHQFLWSKTTESSKSLKTDANGAN